MIRALFVIVICSMFLSCALPPYSSDKAVAGWVEKVRIDQHAFDIKAKLDTGAKTSSIYAEDIKRIRKGGERWVRFTLRLTDTDDNVHLLKYKKPRVRRVKIKNHDGDHDARVVVELDVLFNGTVRKTQFTLADRSEFIYGVLLGRDFLEGRALVDSDSTFLTEPDGVKK